MGRLKKRGEKEENDDDDNDQQFYEIDQSLENFNDIGPHNNPKAFSQLISGKKSTYKGPKDCQKVEVP